MNVYDIVTKRILDELKNGVIPWARSWKPEYHLPMNWLTGRFESHLHYYMTLFHEAIHSTGHESRLSRVLAGRGEDIKAYAQEELIAEIGSVFLCNLSGIDSEEMLKRNTSYLQSWLSLLEDHPRMILIASSTAQKAVDLITNISSRGNLKVVA